MIQATIVRACPLCDSSDHSREVAKESYDPKHLSEFAFASRKVPEYMHYRLVLCENCDLIYASPVPESGRLEDEYRVAAYDSGREAQCAARTYARLVQPILAQLPDRAGALDIGAGDGAFLKELLGFGFTEVVGAEPSTAPIAAADESIRPLLRHAPFRAEDYRGQQFSLITCFQTLEHVPDPLQICRDAFGLLKEGEAMLCVVHNRLSFSARLLGQRSPIYDIEHLQLFSHPSAERLFQSAGFRKVRSSTVCNRYPISYWMRLFPMPGGLKKVAIAAADATGIGRLPMLLPAGNLAVHGFR